MGRIFSPRNLIGIILVGLGVACVIIFARMTLPSSVTVVVASVDLKPGDQITNNNVHSEDWMQVDPQSLDNMITLDQWDQYIGARVALGQEIHQGHPISPSQVLFDARLNDAVQRVTLLAAKDKVVVPIDMIPGQVGNWIRADDYVDLIFSVGQAPSATDLALAAIQPAANPLNNPGATPQPAAQQLPGQPLTQATPGAVQMPLATVPLLNVHVLRVDHQQKQIYVNNSAGQQISRYVDGDVQRIYVELAPSDATVVGFLLQSGKVIAASHQSPLSAQSQNVGISWTDFVNWFEGHRADLFNKAAAGQSAPQVAAGAPKAPPAAVSVQPTPIGK